MRSFCYLGLLAWAVFTTEASLSFTSSLPTIQHDQTPLVLTCNFSLDPRLQQEWDAVVSLTISRLADPNDTSSTAEELSSVTFAHPDTPRGMPALEDGQTSGHLDISGGESFLRVSFSQPGQKQAGRYVCQPRGQDEYGHTLTVPPGTEDVAYQAVDIADLLDRISGLEKQLEDCQAHPGDSSGDSGDHIGGDTQLTALAELLADQIMATDPEFIAVSQIFNNSRVYFILGPDIDYFQSIAACKLYTGNPAEINTEEEFDFIANLLNASQAGGNSGSPNIRGFMTMTYFDGSGWVHAAHPDDPVYLGHWLPGYPSHPASNNVLRVEHSMNSIGLSYGPHGGVQDMPILCEVGV